jgi:thiamine biosynthesis lipoprotein
LHLDGRRVEKAHPALTVDLGAIAKGYAIDRAAEVLRRAGIESAAINAGGDIRLIGDHGARPWRIAIQHPRDSARPLATLELADAAVVTSGDYERFFEQDGVRYHHIFDPRTGYPAGRCQSVTVVAPSAALADALSTAVFVLGPEEGFALLQRFPEAEGLIVAADGTPQASPGLEAKLTWR